MISCSFEYILKKQSKGLINIKKIVAVFLILPLVLMCSCDNSKSKKELCDRLFSDYTLNAEYSLIENDSEVFSGALNVTKGDIITAEFLSPEDLSGVRIESDEYSQPDIITFSYYGIRIPLPDKLLSKLNLMFSAFSNNIPERISGLASDGFEVITENGEEMLKCIFQNGSTTHSVIFEIGSGIPKIFTAQNGNISFTAKIKEFRLLPENDKE